MHFASTMREHGLQHSLIVAIAVVREHELQRSWKRQWRSPSKTVWAQMLVVSSAQPHIWGGENRRRSSGSRFYPGRENKNVSGSKTEIEKGKRIRDCHRIPQIPVTELQSHPRCPYHHHTSSNITPGATKENLRAWPKGKRLRGGNWRNDCRGGKGKRIGHHL